MSIAEAETQTTLSPDAAAARLRLRGFTVREHGPRWLVRQAGSERILTLTSDDLGLAARLAQAAEDTLTIDELASSLYTATGETPPGAAVNEPPGGWGPKELPIAEIRRDGGTQARVGLDEDTVQEYADAMREGRWDWQTIKCPIVCWDSEGYWLADGFHRIEAAQRAGLKEYPVEVLRGGKRAAQLRAAGANTDHGLRRTNADKRRAVELLLKDEEWCQWSDREIARRCQVSPTFVGEIRRMLSVHDGQMPATRKVERGGTTYEMTPAAQPAPTAINRPDGAPVGSAPFWQSMSPAHPTAHLWIQTGMYSFRSACGMTAQRAPSGSREAGHCSSCVRSAAQPTPIDTLTADMAATLEEEFGIPVEVEAYDPLPPAPDGWTIWRNDDGQVGMQHASGYKIGGTDAQALIEEAKSVEGFLGELATNEWKVFYDPTCPPNLHAYTATHEHLGAIAAHDIPHLALLAWRANLFEDDLPDWDDALIDALYLNGENPIELAEHDTGIGELYHLAGLDRPTTTTAAPAADDTPHLPPRAEYRAAQERARACGFRLDMDARGTFVLYRLSDGAEHNSREDWALALAMITHYEAEHLRALCERAESLGATIDYNTYSEADLVRVIPPTGYQQTPLKCTAADLAQRVAAWERNAAPRSAEPTLGIEERLGLAMEQANHLLRLLEACNWTGAQHTCKLLARTMGVSE